MAQHEKLRGGPPGTGALGGGATPLPARPFDGRPPSTEAKCWRAGYSALGQPPSK